jgi:hypothetical protein
LSWLRASGGSLPGGATGASLAAQQRAPRSPEIASVEIEFRSDPSGAVVSSSAGVLGSTPLVVTRPQARSTERFQFQREGFETSTLDVSCEKNLLLQVSLRPGSGAAPRGAKLVPAGRPRRAPRASSHL